MNLAWRVHCVKSVRIRSFSCQYFPTFGLNTRRYSVSLRIQSECGTIRTRKTPNTDTFHAVVFFHKKILKELSLNSFFHLINEDLWNPHYGVILSHFLAQNLANQDFPKNIALLVLRKELKKEKMFWKIRIKRKRNH